MVSLGASMSTAATPTSPTTGSIDWRREWHEFDGATYLNLAGQSPVPKSAIRAIQSAIEWKKFPHHIPDTAYFDLPNKVRASIAKLIGGKPEEVALTAGASTGMLAVAFGLTWKPVEQRAGITLKFISPRDRFLTADDFSAARTPQMRLVAVSLVRFDNAG